MDDSARTGTQVLRKLKLYQSFQEANNCGRKEGKQAPIRYQNDFYLLPSLRRPIPHLDTVASRSFDTTGAETIHWLESLKNLKTYYFGITNTTSAFWRAVHKVLIAADVELKAKFQPIESQATHTKSFLTTGLPRKDFIPVVPPVYSCRIRLNSSRI